MKTTKKNSLTPNWYKGILFIICLIYFFIDVFDDNIKGLIMWGIAAILNILFTIIDHQHQIYKKLNEKDKENKDNFIV